MKRRFVIVVGILIALCANADVPSFAVKPVRVLYLGDSLSDFDRGSNHVDRLQAKLDAVSPCGVNIYNYAVRGDYIERMMIRFAGGTNCSNRAAYDGIWGRQYDWAMVFLGHNDTRAWSTTGFSSPEMSAEQVRQGYGQLIDLLQAKGIGRIILVSASSSNYDLTLKKSEAILEAMKTGKKKQARVVRYGTPAFQEAFNGELQVLAKRSGVEYLDLYTPMKARPDKPDLVRPTDGVHLTEKGHAFVADCEFDYLMRTSK